MTNLATTALIIFGFDIVNIVVFGGLMPELSFVDSVLDYGRIFPVKSEYTTCRQKAYVANLDLT